MELLQCRFHDGKDRRKQSGIESDSLPDQNYKEQECYPGNEVEKKWEMKNGRGLLAECPAGAKDTPEKG